MMRNVVLNTRDFEVVRRIYCPLLRGGVLVDAPNAISNFVALEFTGGGLDDIMEFAVNHQIRYFVQGSKIYVDARKDAGLFLILA